MPRKRQTTKSKIVKAAWNLFYKKDITQRQSMISSLPPEHPKAAFIIILKEKMPCSAHLPICLMINTKSLSHRWIQLFLPLTNFSI